MNPPWICGGAIREARDRTERGCEPGRRRGTGILHKRSALWVLECTLGFAVVVKPEFIDRAVVDGPGMADIPLLKALFCRRSKAGHVGASGLELSKRRDQAVVVEIIVN